MSTTAALDHRELGRRGREYYERFLRAKLEREYNGKFLAIEVESGDYELGDSTLDALERAEAKHPDCAFCLLRIGHRTVGRI